MTGACHVTQVDVRSNNLDANVGQLFIPIIEKPHFESFSGIPVKKIRDNAISEIDVKGVEDSKLEACGGVILAHCLKSNSSVTVVEAFGCAFGAEGGKAMAAALEANKTLEEISVGNVIVGSTVKLKSSGELKLLTDVDDIHGYVKYEGSGGWVKPSTFEPIPAVLPLKKLRDNTITELDLKSSDLGVDGGMMLAAVLKSNSSVTKVSDEWLV